VQRRQYLTALRAIHQSTPANDPAAPCQSLTIANITAAVAVLMYGRRGTGVARGTAPAMAADRALA
jgi:hypothetical protein